jgi:hypothetical protein
MVTVDKRSVHTDALATLGTIIGDGEARDAIHLAVEPVVAGMALNPAAHVALGVDGRAYAPSCVPGGKAVGIVDPFVETIVPEGSRFWLVVYPRRITSLRHVWEHPDFDTPAERMVHDEKAVSRAWIEAYAEELSGEDYDDEIRIVTSEELIEYATTWATTTSRWGGDYLVKGGLLEGVGTKPEFWDHFTVVTGLAAPTERPNFFSCSC